MSALKRLTFVLLWIVTLSGCGFALKGMGDNAGVSLPFESVYIENATSISSQVDTVFKRKKNVRVVDNADNADAILKIYGESTQKDLSVINRGGSAKEYLLVLSVQVQLLKDGVGYGKPLDIVVRRTYAHSDNQVLGKNEEEAMLWDDMRQDAAGQIIRRLPYLKPTPENIPLPSKENKTEETVPNHKNLLPIKK